VARLAAIAALLILANCGTSSSPVEPPPFNNCWRLFPPGPRFDEQIRKYTGTADPNVVELGCLPTYKLNRAACQDFAKVGPGDWPSEITAWCSERYKIQLANVDAQKPSGAAERELAPAGPLRGPQVK